MHAILAGRKEHHSAILLLRSGEMDCFMRWWRVRRETIYTAAWGPCPLSIPVEPTPRCLRLPDHGLELA